MNFAEIYIRERDHACREAFRKQKMQIEATEWLLEVLAEVEDHGLRVKAFSLRHYDFCVSYRDGQHLCNVSIHIERSNMYEYHVKIAKGIRGSSFCFIDSEHALDHLKNRIHTQIAHFLIDDKVLDDSKRP